jgi:hypothetical protein
MTVKSIFDNPNFADFLKCIFQSANFSSTLNVSSSFDGNPESGLSYLSGFKDIIIRALNPYEGPLHNTLGCLIHLASKTASLSPTRIVLWLFSLFVRIESKMEFVILNVLYVIFGCMPLLEMKYRIRKIDH